MLHPRNVLITGANRGLGLELVKQFLQLPVPPKNVLATCRNPENAEELNDVARTHNNVNVLKLDVTKTDEIGSIASSSEKIFSNDGLNLLINNAGISYKKQYVGNLNKQKLIEQFDVNVFGPALVTQALLPYLRQAAKSLPDLPLCCNRAAVVNMSSILASIELNKTGGLYPYRTSKAALNMLTKSMNSDLKADGILCFCLHPGWVQTDMGGPNADVTKETSILGLLEIMSKMGKDSDIFVDYSGKTLPW